MWKTICVDKQNTLLYDGETMAIFPLDNFEDRKLLDELFSGELSEDSKEELKYNTKGLKNNNWGNLEKNYVTTFSSIVLPISSACNLNCPYCFAQTSKGGFNFKDFKREDIDKLLKAISLSKEKRTTLIFFGGEPLIKFDIIEYTVKKVKKDYSSLNIGYSITTNGTLITERIAKFFKMNQFSVLLSLDGYDNEFNLRRFKNGRTSVNRVLRSIDILKKCDVYFEIRATLTSNNPYMYETFVFFEKLSAPFNIAFAYASENKSNPHLTSYQKEELNRIKKAFEQLFGYYCEIIREGASIHNITFHTIKGELENRLHKELICSAGGSYITVMSDGNIFSCAHLMNDSQYIIGNINDVKGIDLNSYNFTPKKVTEINECQNCWAKNLCNGGCPSQKVSLGKTAYEAFPKEECELNRIMYEFYIKLYYVYKSTKAAKSGE